ncbi:MAG: DUF4097 family beta strand repeat protein [Acidobacteria bacterium]|nr:DUF4097 family beta strand repeat protein [Candidatus Sulfomarinibacter kjeldsenii]
MHARFTITAIAALCLFATGASAEIEVHEKHRFDARPGATVVIDVSFHSVEVTAQPGSSVDVTVDLTIKGDGSSAKNIANDLSPVFKEDGDKLIIRSVRKKGWNWKSVKAKGKIAVQMPPGMNLTIDSSSGSARINGDFGDSKVVFDASSGSLTVDGAMRELHSDVSSGSVRATVSRPLEVFTSDASSGSARLTGGARVAHVESSSGSINVSGLLGEGKFSASSGSIKAQWDAIPPQTTVRASASSGSVTLWFPQGTKISGSLDVSSGGLHSDFPALVRGKDRLELDGGPDAVNIEVDTSSGSIKLLTN